jgi:plastocyanin
VIRVISLLLMFLVISSCEAKPQKVEPVKTQAVRILDASFEPKTIVVKLGSTVTWTSESFGMHNVVFPGARSPWITKGKTWEYTFKEAGKIEYYCEPHRGMGMVGTIVVEE